MNSSVKIRLIGYCFTACMFGFVIFLGKEAWFQHYAYKNYRAIDVEIVQTEIIRFTPSGNKVGFNGYEPRITFRYEVADRQYLSHQFWCSGTKRCMKEKEAEIFVIDYPVGKIMTGYYNPLSPSHAYLIKRLIFDKFIGIVLFNVLIFFSLWFLFIIEPYRNTKVGSYRRIALCMFWFLNGSVCFGYYFYYSDRIQIWVSTVSVIYFLLGFCWAYYLLNTKFYKLQEI